MTGFELFMKEAKECGFDEKKAKMLYKELYKHYNPNERDSGYVKLTTDEAFLASFLLTKFGAKIRKVNFTTVKEEYYLYNIKLL